MSAGKNKSKHTAEKELRALLKKDAREFASLYAIGKSISSTLDLGEILDLITKKVSQVMKADVCTVRLLERKNRLVLKSSHGAGGDSPELKNDMKVGEGVVGLVAKTKKPIIIKDLREEDRYTFNSFIEKRKLRSLLSVPLIEMHKAIGVFTVYCRKKDFYSNEDKKILALFASQATIAIENAKLFEKTRSNYINTMRFFASLIDVKEKYTADHSNRVMRNVIKIANALNLSGRRKEMLRYASLLHDIGKIAIDTSVLSKQDPLTESEWGQMKAHPVIGAQIIRKIGFLDDLIPVIMYHHAKYGGGGYPDGDIRGDEIPLEARILAVADSYEAMTSDRPYRKALSKEEAIEELKKHSGGQFDPKIVETFLAVLGQSE